MGKLDAILPCFGEILFFLKGRQNITSQPQNSLCLTGNTGIAKSHSALTTSPSSLPSYNPALWKTNESSDWKGPDENNMHALNTGEIKQKPLLQEININVRDTT